MPDNTLWIAPSIYNAPAVQGAAFSIVLRGTEKTVVNRKKVANIRVPISFSELRLLITI